MPPTHFPLGLFPTECTPRVSMPNLSRLIILTSGSGGHRPSQEPEGRHSLRPRNQLKQRRLRRMRSRDSGSEATEARRRRRGLGIGERGVRWAVFLLLVRNSNQEEKILSIAAAGCVTVRSVSYTMAV